ncbi:venom protein 164-like [Hydractinia symbiolongicarpus]|uniref:venom protein 164-like n=1 Tax=Hydractinia symbiolongicarpus TaxID=13093 RepID=UPI00254BAB4F|nr:venom protein 164-like [Hydractinia symbiolongicarpus]
MKIVLVLLALAVAAVCGDGIVWKKCTSDSDCGPDECCTKMALLGNRCRWNLKEGTMCKTVTESVVDKIHKRCPCGNGLSCTHVRTLAGLYKVYQCKKTPTS